jgi:hypothetical protein
VSQLPPPAGAPRPGPSPLRSRRGRRGTVIAIVAAGVATALVVGGAIWGGSALIGAARKGDAHDASHALTCAGSCISLADAGRLLTGPTAADDVAALGLDPEPTSDPTDPSTPTEDWSSALDSWDDAEPTGDECMFTYLVTPVAATAHAKPRADDSTTVELPEYEADDEDDAILDTGMRVFDDSADAEQHMGDMRRLISGCHRYRISEDAGGWDARVTSPVVWDALPGDVAAIAWVEDAGSQGRYYGIDLQRGNLVVRTTLTTGEIGLAAIRHYVTTEAARMAAITVHPGAAKGERPPNA